MWFLIRVLLATLRLVAGSRTDVVLGRWFEAVASISCCNVQAAVGWTVTLRYSIRRRACEITKKTYKGRNVTVGTVRKSTAQIPSLVPEERAPVLGGRAGVRRPAGISHQRIGAPSPHSRRTRARPTIAGGVRARRHARGRAIGIEPIVTPYRAPQANAVVERLVGTLRRECFCLWE